ncbi:hypothetical protein S7335_2510 [Synechococcus sp. PCC 7335]|uniref:hypothetical protein n=1 Tax=Synechococcus sp. (strain ATCC 29403 / PCC 7335) TaxID=91464 RepID=UPI00017EDCDF|nr:hypothetical protein [Synechococcus sp. PCC 7335]EDX84813.1 hypothetical protein S7335_2510 [Synechococcus sp. PCC 7335]
MSSPFSTIEDFNSAIDGPTEGAIYTFANSPTINIIALLLAVGIFIWFIVSTYITHTKPSRVDKSMNHLSSLIVVGLLSLVTLNQWQPKQSPTIAQRRLQDTSRSSVQAEAPSKYTRSGSQRLPIGLLGMVSLGFPSFSRLRNRRRSSSSSRYRTRR